ncbi:hypothetical protein AB0J86_04255 [Micromonospora sp. NPDC049559]|uniref:hypothetical protein n=1 Tax=Micromonospora sp. NPDC049559 TaxID=3155923 RepID=UPI003448F4F5
MGGINWPEVIAGFCLGLAPLFVRQIIVVVRYLRLPGRTKYMGVWWQYHRSTTGSGEVIERRTEIKHSLLFDRFTIDTPVQQAPEPVSAQLKYSGHISSRQGMVRYVSLRGDSSHERLSWYLFDPFFSPVNSTYGLYICLDLWGMPTSGPMMLSRERIGVDEASRQLEDHVLRFTSLIERDSTVRIGLDLLLSDATAFAATVNR